MPVQITTTKKVHPFAAGWAEVQRHLSEKKQMILDGTGWPERTFYNRISDAINNKLSLNQAEAEAISKALQIPIENFSQNIKK